MKLLLPRVRYLAVEPVGKPFLEPFYPTVRGGRVLYPPRVGMRWGVPTVTTRNMATFIRSADTGPRLVLRRIT